MKKAGVLARTLGTLMFYYKFIVKGFFYSMLAYQIIDNWYDAALFRGGMKSNCVLKVRHSSKATILQKIACAFAKGVFVEVYNRKRVRVRYRNRYIYFNYKSDVELANMLAGINEQFVQEQYKQLNLKGKVIVDVGASIGDSAVYFAFNGADKIIALEPYPYAYNIAKQTIELNSLGKKVRLINKACMPKHGSITIDPDFKSNDRDAVKVFNKGVRVGFITLEDLVKAYKLKGAVLKMDCEGREYDIINRCKANTLNKFDEILIEFHFGFLSLERTLEQAGFEVRHTIPLYAKHIDNKTNALYGFLFATKQTMKRS